jgi:hypothetical protein
VHAVGKSSNPEGTNEHLLDVAVCTSKPAGAELQARQVPKIGNFSDVVAQHFNMRHGMSNFRLGGKVN